MTTVFDHRAHYTSSTSTPQRMPADLFVVLMWSLVGLLLSALLTVAGYSPDLPVLQVMASG